MKVFRNLITFLILVSVPFSVFLLQQKTNFLGKAFGDKANIYVDAGNYTGRDDENWRNLAQGGEDRGRQLINVIDKTSALSPRYIRIDHVFDYYNIVSRNGGTINYNFQELDGILEDIKKTGAKPLIALSYMPPTMSKSGNVEDLPNNWAEWENLVQATVEHVSGRSGLGINNVYYEVWNEPDLFGKFKVYGEKNYLDLYLHTAIGVQRARNVHPFKFGGPATTGFYEDWMNKLVIFSQQNNLKLDFLSWHRYSLQLEQYEKDASGASHFSGLETLITESGPNSETDSINDSHFAAIHTIATAITLDGKVNKIFNFEIKDGAGPQKYWGRWGLITNEKHGAVETKPRYDAIRFLNNLNSGKSLFVSGNGSWVKAVAKEKDGKILVMIVNYDETGKHKEAVPIKIANLKSNSFTLKRIDFKGRVTEQKINSTNNTYEALLAFEPNTASLLEISY